MIDCEDHGLRQGAAKATKHNPGVTERLSLSLPATRLVGAVCNRWVDDLVRNDVTWAYNEAEYSWLCEDEETSGMGD